MNITRIRNLTPHPVHILDEEGKVIRKFDAEEQSARANSEYEYICDFDGVPIERAHFSEPLNLPEPEESVYLIVSVITANAAKEYGRAVDDLLIPTRVIRNEENTIVGCMALGLIG